MLLLLLACRLRFGGVAHGGEAVLVVNAAGGDGRQSSEPRRLGRGRIGGGGRGLGRYIGGRAGEGAGVVPAPKGVRVGKRSVRCGRLGLVMA